MNNLKVSDFYKKLFGSKVYKISIDAGCTCPTRDGTKGFGGCIFCSANGSGDFVPSKLLSISEQIEEAKGKVDIKFSRKQKRGIEVEKKYIVYFQNFTSTYGDEELLIKKYEEAVNSKDVVGLAIGTRPDCLGEKILNYLGELSKTFYVQLELGLQTSNEKTAEFIRRHYENAVYEEAVKRIKKAGKNIHIVTHIIFGLPDETEQDMLASVDFAVKNGTDGIKITSLYILKGTDLQTHYENGEFRALEMEEYFELIKKALLRLPENIVIHRLTGDGPKSLLIAPLWTADKKRVLNYLNNIKLH